MPSQLTAGAQPPDPWLARIWFTWAAAWASAAFGWDFPSITETIMVPSTIEICGYVAITGRACLTLPRLVMNVLTLGREASIAALKPGALATDARIGRSP